MSKMYSTPASHFIRATMSNPTGERSCMAILASRLGGHLDAWLTDEGLQAITPGPTTISQNSISATFELAPNSKFLVCWGARSPITALCAVTHCSGLPGENALTKVYGMDEADPTTQTQASHGWESSDISGWFASPPAGGKGFVRLEFRKALRNGIYPHGYVLDPHEASFPPIILWFNLVDIRSRAPSPEPSITCPSALSCSRKCKRAASELDDGQSVCVQTAAGCAPTEESVMDLVEPNDGQFVWVQTAARCAITEDLVIAAATALLILHCAAGRVGGK
ncbi:hypothetical protein DFH06DRAFT_1304120 [Mycena polygramma]|nr:hypothetical protein DFH06DRAFT_1304120 [Mycena polygramma]